jgi:cysteinyl-tRNA synthetase
VEEAMDDDFNAAQALGYFYDLQKHLNILLDNSKGRPNEEIVSLLKQGLNHFSQMGWIFGLFQEDPELYLGEQKREGLKKLNLSEEEILKLIEDRNAARSGKNWKRADDIRNELLTKGIILEDSSSGTSWKIK